MDCELVGRVLKKYQGDLEQALRAVMQPPCAWIAVRGICEMFAKCLKMDEAELLRMARKIRRNG